MASFALDVARFAEKAKAAPGIVQRKVGIELLRNVVLATPVGNPSLWKGPAPKGYVGGRLRANWNASLGVPDLSTGAPPDKTGLGAIARGTAKLAASDGERDIYLMNSMPYVREIEYTGHSTQAPAGMVRITVTNYQQFIDNAVRGLPK